MMVRVAYQELADTLQRALLGLGFEEGRAQLCARLFAETTRDGVYTHGLNRFPRFVRMIRSGVVDLHARPQPVGQFGVLERWDGRRGPGNLAAHECMARTIALARDHGMGCVALANTNHWMRAGSYGWQAAEAGVIGLCWTNTMPNLPPWGSTQARLGNNPFVLAVPRAKGHIVLDIAMSQFSYGALASYRERRELLPVEGGYDAQGVLTRDPGAIEASQRALPIGYWKGSGLSLLLDLLAALLSGGRATHQIPAEPEREAGLSQVFVAIDARPLGPAGEMEQAAERIIESLQSPAAASESVRYPGERTLQIRAENLALGVPVDPAIWREVQGML